MQTEGTTAVRFCYWETNNDPATAVHPQTHQSLRQRFPTSGRNPNQGRGVSDVVSAEGFM